MRRAARWALHQGSAADDEHEGDVDDEMRRNLACGRALRLELVTILLADGQGTGATEAIEVIEVIEVIEAAPPEQRALGRFRWAEARAAVLAGRLDRAGSIIHGGIVVADLREGELALEDL